MKTSKKLMMNIDFNTPGDAIKKSIEFDKKEKVILRILIERSPYKFMTIRSLIFNR
jgi:hypothetical protein